MSIKGCCDCLWRCFDVDRRHQAGGSPDEIRGVEAELEFERLKKADPNERKAKEWFLEVSMKERLLNHPQKSAMGNT